MLQSEYKKQLFFLLRHFYKKPRKSMAEKKVVNFLFQLGLFAGILFLTGCEFGYHDLIPAEFPQYKHYSQGAEDLKTHGQNNLKSVRIYDEFETVALFDFLRFADEIALICAHLKSDRRGVNKKHRNQILMHELAINQNEFKILLQADVRKSFQENLDKKNSPWSFWLEMQDGQIVKPTTIKKIKHTDITKQLFGTQYSRFKTLYQLSFALSGGDLVQAKNRRGPLTIVCRSSEQKCRVSWPAASGWIQD